MTPFHVASSQEVDEVTPDRSCRTIETGRTRKRFWRNTAAGVIESTVNDRFGERGKDHRSGERL